MPSSESIATLPEINVVSTCSADRRIWIHFASILAAFTSIYLLSWPLVFSLDLWILKDRGSFLNLDYLLDQHLRLGVDTFYSYGLLPVLIQHWLFVLFGRGYWPLIGCAVVTMILMAWFCALLLRYLGCELVWFLAILVMGRILNPVNPNLPYSIVQLSMLFALLFVLLGRLEYSLAASVIGCWSVPSLPWVMTFLLVGFILLNWFGEPSRSVTSLLRSLAPGALTYLGIGVALTLQFGLSSVIATAIPLAGMRFYKQNYPYGSGLLQFLHPWGYSPIRYLAYIVLTPVCWWVLSTLGLVVLAIVAARRMTIRRALDLRDIAIALCASIQVVFAVVAYGPAHQHYLFDPILIVGVLVGLSSLQYTRMRNLLLTGFLALGVMGQAVLAHADLQAWKTVKFPTVTANLYADPRWVTQWKRILDLSRRENVLLLSYSTGAHEYFPTIHSPETWAMERGQLFPSDESRVLAQIDNASVVVLDMTSPTAFLESYPKIQSHLYFKCLTQSTLYFQVWRQAPGPGGGSCINRSTTVDGRTFEEVSDVR